MDRTTGLTVDEHVAWIEHQLPLSRCEPVQFVSLARLCCAIALDSNDILGGSASGFAEKLDNEAPKAFLESLPRDELLSVIEGLLSALKLCRGFMQLIELAAQGAVDTDESSRVDLVTQYLRILEAKGAAGGVYNTSHTAYDNGISTNTHTHTYADEVDASRRRKTALRGRLRTKSTRNKTDSPNVYQDTKDRNNRPYSSTSDSSGEDDSESIDARAHTQVNEYKKKNYNVVNNPKNVSPVPHATRRPTRVRSSSGHNSSYASGQDSITRAHAQARRGRERSTRKDRNSERHMSRSNSNSGVNNTLTEGNNISLLDVHSMNTEVGSLVGQEQHMYGNTGGRSAEVRQPDEVVTPKMLQELSVATKRGVPALLQLIRRYPRVAKLQRLGLKALAGRLRDSKSNVAQTHVHSSGEEKDDMHTHGDGSVSPIHVSRETASDMSAVLDAMRRCKKDGEAARYGMSCLSCMAGKSPESMKTLAADGGVTVLLDAMESFPADTVLQASGLGVLGSPAICSDSVVRINYDKSLTLTLQAMRFHQGNPQILGLGALAVANLLVKGCSADKIIALEGISTVLEPMLRAWKTLGLSPEEKLSWVQVAAGCAWSIGTMSGFSPILRKNIDHEGGVVTLSELLLNCETDIGLLTDCSTRDGKDSKSIMDEGVRQKLIGLEAVRKNAAHALEQLTREEGGEDMPRGSCSIQ